MRISLACYTIAAIVGSTHPLFGQSSKPTITAHVSTQEVYAGESFQVRVVIEGIQDPALPDLSAIRDATITFLSRQNNSRRNTRIINGRIVQSDTYSNHAFTYEITPNPKAISCTAGPIRITHNRKTYTAPGQTVRVISVQKQDTVVLSLHTSATRVRIREPFTVSLELLIKQLPDSFSETEPIFPDSGPLLEADFLDTDPIEGLTSTNIARLLEPLLTQKNAVGFYINDHTLRNSSPFAFSILNRATRAKFKLPYTRTNHNNTGYYRYVIELPYHATTAGSYTFGPASFKGTIPTGVANNRPVVSNIYTVARAINVHVLAPPLNSRPDSYVGAITTNLNVAASLDMQTFQIGDPITLTLDISALEDRDSLTAPALSQQKSITDLFDVYDNATKSLNLADSKQFIYTLRPKRSGTLEFPGVDVSYYDYASHTYTTVSTRPIPIRVNKSIQISSEQIMQAVTNLDLTAASTLASSHVAAMRLTNGRNGGGPELPPLALWILALGGPTMFSLVLVGRMGLSLRQSEAVLQSRRAREKARAVAKLLTLSKKASCDSNELVSTVREAIGLRFDCTPSSLTPTDIITRLAQEALNEEALASWQTILDHHFNAQYSDASSRSAAEDAATLYAILTHKELV